MTWTQYSELVKNGPINTKLRVPMEDECDDHLKFLAFFPKERERQPTWGYLSLAYIETHEKFMRGEQGGYPLWLVCSHWLPCPPAP